MYTHVVCAGVGAAFFFYSREIGFAGAVCVFARGEFGKYSVG